MSGSSKYNRRPGRKPVSDRGDMGEIRKMIDSAVKRLESGQQSFNPRYGRKKK
jgi:hypothetical protein